MYRRRAIARRPGAKEISRRGRIAVKHWVLASLLAVSPIAVAGAQEFPTRPVKMVVGFGPGGLGDIVTRAVAQKLTESFGKPFVVENLPGAGGITAAASVAKAPADGHTMLLVSGQNAVSPSLFKSLPYDPVADFAMVSTIGFFDFLIIADKGSPLKNVGDLLAKAKADPGRFNMGTISVGSIQNLSALLFASTAGIAVPTVPFRSTGEVITALKSGEVQVGFETLPGVIGQVRSGEMRAIAVAAERRIALLPDVPTVAESGLAGYTVVSWNGFVVPSKTPREIVMRLSKAVAMAVEAPDLRQRFSDLGIEARASTPEQMQKVYDEDAVKWRDVIVRAKIEPQ
jgi:tripartite-type tricarboxylate transporter receptor subunit TctC